LKDIKDDVLGNVVAKICVIKFQKKGLPRGHILFILDEALKLRITEDYNLMLFAILRRTRWSLRAWCMGHVV
jgi:hypothetical protein